MSTPSSVFVPAYAKINLTLDVLGRRDDGFHALASVMQTIALHDTLLIRATTDGEICVMCDDPALQTSDNLALRAARLLRAELGDERLGATIELRKMVPAQAGLGGGSSDAAAVLVALDALWSGCYDSERLKELGARLGSDVPFFIRGGTALIEGRGELVTPLLDAEPLWIVLAKPHIGLSTPAVFRQLTPANYTDSTATHAVVELINGQHPLHFDGFHNALEPGVLRAFPAVAAARDALRTAGAATACMSGSGPTIYAPFRELAHARAAYDQLLDLPLTIWLTHTITSGNVRASLPMVPFAR